MMRSSSSSPLVFRMLQNLLWIGNNPKLAEMVRKTRQAQAREAAEGPPWLAGYGANNKLMSWERAEVLRKRLGKLPGH